MEREIDRQICCSCSVVHSVPVRCSEEGAELRGGAFISTFLTLNLKRLFSERAACF